MKKVLLSIAIVASLAACNTPQQDPAPKVIMVSPENSNGAYSNVLSDKAKEDQFSANQQNVAVTHTRKPKTIIVRHETVRIIHDQAPATQTVYTNSTAPVATSVPVVKEKKGWSNAAKDAVIGGVGGAVGGAVISKQKAKGAIIGGVIGAAGGYILGRSKDKKEAANNNYVYVNQ